MADFLAALFGKKPAPAPAAAPTPKPTPAPTSSKLAVEVRDVSKAYGDFWALRNVSLEVPKGECLGIVGYNGAGKSTLLQLIAGTVQPTSGTIATHGRVVALLELGAGYNDDFTGLENIYMNAAILGVSKEAINARLPDIEAFAEIGDFLHKPVKTYSTGMRVRLAFSMLTQVDPDIMIIDEALAVGDAYFAHKCTKVIRRFREQGRTLLFVSHDPQAVKTLCDRAILIDRGVVVRQGSAVDILDYYNAMIASRERDREIRELELQSGRRITRSGNRKAVLERFELLDAQDRPVRAVLMGSQVKVCCVIVFQEPVAEPTVGFIIRDRLGNDVFGTNTFHLKMPTGNFNPGERAEVCFVTTLNIGLGNYSLTLAVHSGASHVDENYDWFDKLLAFSVVQHWPFVFLGAAALPAQAEISREIRHLRRTYSWGTTIDFSQAGNSYLFQVDGWSVPDGEFCWTDGKRATLAFELPPTECGAVLTLEGAPYLAPGMPSQTIDVSVGGERIAQWVVTKQEKLVCTVPARLLKGELQLDLSCPHAVSPADLNLAPDRRHLALAVRRLTWIEAK